MAWRTRLGPRVALSYEHHNFLYRSVELGLPNHRVYDIIWQMISLFQ